MKKIFASLLFLISFLSLSACNNDNNVNGNYNEPIGFSFHYYRSDLNYDDYNMWIWENNQNGADYSFDGVDNYGAYMYFVWSDWTSDVKTNGINFIVKEAKPWSEGPIKDVEADRSVLFTNMSFSSIDGYYHIYLKSGDPTIYGEKIEIGDEIVTNEFYSDYQTKEIRLKIETNKEYSDLELKKDGETLFTIESLDSSKIISQDETLFIYNFINDLPDFSSSYIINVTFKESGKTISSKVDLSKLYTSKAFDEKYTYDKELGAIYDKQGTTFKVWSPVSSKIELRIYESGTPKSLSSNGSDEYKSYEMIKEDKGVFSCRVTGDLNGKYYTYVVTNSLYKNQEIVDPYAKSSGINGLRGMIIDLNETNPENWDDIEVYNYNSQSLTVYECHIADLTSSTTWNGTPSNAKTYNGFYEENTTYTENNITVKTGFDHIKELGVNAVQLLPIFDQANDEREEYRSFNWGYNPLNYNVLEGSYSSNPYDGSVRVKEFKNLVMAYNKAGINIIMDVVYNHVNNHNKSNFDVLMPKYYFRYSNGNISNGSGCGNETASEMPMFRKFMIDSTEFLAREYKLSGFRFDLMGLHDYNTMNLLTENLHKNVNEAITVYGEPWTGGTTPLQSNHQAIQTNINKFEGFGCFNDKMRDALIKGGLSAKTEKGWVTDTLKGTNVISIIQGLLGNQSSISNEPYKTVNYVTCHDNYTLYDRIKACGITDEDSIKKMAVLANSVVFTSQGITFMLSGEEFLRTKGGNSNSYNSSYKVNELDYSLKIKNFDVFQNYQKLIELKHNSNLFAKTKEECKLIEIHTNSNKTLIYFDLVDTVNNLQYRIAIKNGTKSNENIVDFDGYTLYLDTLNRSDLELDSQTILEDFETIIAYKSIK